MNISQQKLIELKKVFPEVFKEDKIDFEQLKAMLGEEILVNGETFGLSWFGKNEAISEIQKQTTASLVPDFENSIEFENTENIFIEGENLEVLRILQKSYTGKVKLIYIDPPYNTGNNSFVYQDRYNENGQDFEKRTGIKNHDNNGKYHSAWLSMMYPRLYLAKNLLKEDGVIFVSIDDNEGTNLKMLMNEIFGEENFLAQIVWQRSFSPVNLKRYFSESHDYILCYAKNISQCKIKGLRRGPEALKRYKNPDNDPRGLWTSGGIDVGPIITEKVYPITTPSGRVVLPPHGYCWRFTKEKFDEMVKDNRIWFGSKGDTVPRIKRFLSEVKERITPMTLWLRDEVGDSQSASRALKNLFNGKAYFDYPKPVELISRCIELIVDDNDIVLDFFAGSGTTAHALIEYNLKNDLNCKFILVQLPEALNPKSEAFKSGFKTIADIAFERIKLVIGLYKDQKIGVKKFILKDANS